MKQQQHPDSGMSNSGAVRVKLELGHHAQVRKKPTVEGFTHDWTVFVRGPEHNNIQYFVEKVVFHLHESFSKPKRVCKDPPYKVEESGYAGFILPVEIYFKNKEEPKKVRFDYDLFLHVDGHPPVNHLRCEKITFNNPTEEFRRKLLKAGGQRDPHKLTSQDSKDGFKGSRTTHLTTVTTISTNSSSFSNLRKPSKDHKDKHPKNLKESKSAFRDSDWEHRKVPNEPFRKPKENQPIKDINPKMDFKEPKSRSVEHQAKAETCGSGQNKHLSTPNDHGDLKRKRKMEFERLSGKPLSESEDLYSEKKFRNRPQKCLSKRVDNNEVDRRRVSTVTPPRPFQQLVDPVDSDTEDRSTKSDLERLSPASSSSSSGFTPTRQNFKVVDFIIRKKLTVPTTTHPVLGPLHSVMKDLQSDDNEDYLEDDDDSDMDRQGKTQLRHHQRRVSLSEGSESDSFSQSHPSHNEPPPLLKTTNNQILEEKTSSKQDKNKKMDSDKDYLEELVELHKRLMTLREGDILQQVVNLIEETGHFHITNTTFDFDLCSLERSTVRTLQSFLETSRPF